MSHLLFRGVMEDFHVPDPTVLYHCSAFKEEHELKPGFEHTKELVKWDRRESNRWLYAVAEQSSCEGLGIASAVDKKFPKLTRFQYFGDDAVFHFEGDPPRLHELLCVRVYMYTIPFREGDGWKENLNPYNRLKDEWKTKQTVAFSRRDTVDVRRWFNHKNVSIIGS